jgi:hypothetical protein
MNDAEILRDRSKILRSTRTRASTSPPKQRVEVVTREAPRSWRFEEKREVVLASLVPGAMPSATCRQQSFQQLYHPLSGTVLRDRQDCVACGFRRKFLDHRTDLSGNWRVYPRALKHKITLVMERLARLACLQPIDRRH